MNARQEHEQPQREGLGGRVRRFIDSELGRALDSDDRETTARTDAEHDAPPSNPPAAAAAAKTTPATTAETTPATAAETTPATVEGTPATAQGAQMAGRRIDQDAADDSAERVGLLNDPAGLRAEWQQVQGTFVDDPQRAVHEASVLVDRTLQEIHENVRRGQISDPTSTDDLRVSFQRYREFFQRLLSA
jgi:cell wall-associated NlpC family hydrolase